FFASRRRHTRFSRDWSSDVCSSDLSFCYNAKLHFSTIDTSMSSTDTLTPSQTSTNAQVLDATTHANIHDKLARALGIKTAQVNAFVKLYDEGATVPFIARYRKEKTQNLDDAQLRALEKSLNYERDMATRRLDRKSVV